jgi:CRISPR-associated endonuclease Cas2
MIVAFDITDNMRRNLVIKSLRLIGFARAQKSVFHRSKDASSEEIRRLVSLIEGEDSLMFCGKKCELVGFDRYNFRIREKSTIVF